MRAQSPSPDAHHCPPTQPQVNRTSRELSDAQRELATARSRAEVAVRSADSQASEASQKLATLEGEAKGLRDALASAQQRATAAEAKVELLQEAVRKAEERAARLEMERASRAAAPALAAAEGGEGAGGEGAAAATGDGSREAELAAEVRMGHCLVGLYSIYTASHIVESVSQCL